MVRVNDLKEIGVVKDNFEQYMDSSVEEWEAHIEVCSKRCEDDLVGLIGERDFTKFNDGEYDSVTQRRISYALIYLCAKYLYRAELNYLFSLNQSESVADISLVKRKVETQCVKMYLDAVSELIKLGYDV